MRAKDLLKFAVTGLKRRAARTFLTILGVIIGTVCIVLMFAIGLSGYEQLEREISSDQSLTEITVNNYANGAAGGITDSTVQSIGSLEHVKAVSPVIDLPVTIYAGEYEAGMQLKGVDPRIINVTYARGGVFGDDAVPSVVLGGNTMQNFIDPDNPPNFADYMAMESYEPDIDLMNTEMEMILGHETDDPDVPASQRYKTTVSGMTEKSFSESSYNAYIDIDTAKRIIMENRELAEYMGLKLNSYTTVRILVDEMDNVAGVLEEVKKLGYETYSPTEYIAQRQDEQARQQGQLFAIGFISLFVSAIGIANTMYANILERKRDIGVMKVLGMKIRKIRDLFILESALIGTLGGLIGIGVSHIAVIVINTGTGATSFLGTYFYAGMSVSIPLWLSAAALLIAVGVGIVSGVHPARKATKMSALEAMRN